MNAPGVLGEPSRRLILEPLADGEQSVGEIAGGLQARFAHVAARGKPSTSRCSARPAG